MLKLSQCDHISQFILTAEAQSVFVKMCSISVLFLVSWILVSLRHLNCMVGLKKILLHLKLHKVFLKNHSQIFSECNLKFQQKFISLSLKHY